MSQDIVSALISSAAGFYAPAWRFSYRFARGKLGADPLFKGILQQGLIPDRARVLDLGCGQGLLAAWLSAARALYEKGGWPEGWPEPPRLQAYRGADLMQAELRRARRALAHLGEFVQADIGELDFGQADIVTIFDVLHYMTPAAQADVLARAHRALRPAGGVLLLRVGDADGGWRFAASYWSDLAVTFFRGHRLPALHCRSLADWRALLRDIGFEVEARPMYGGTPFANILLVAKSCG